MFISESGLLRFTRLAFCAATVAAVSTVGSLAKEPKDQEAASEPTKKLDTATGFRGQKFGTSFLEFTGLTLERDEGDLKLYINKDKTSNLGPSSSKQLFITFFKASSLRFRYTPRIVTTRCACYASRRRPLARETSERTQKMNWTNLG